MKYHLILIILVLLISGCASTNSQTTEYQQQVPNTVGKQETVETQNNVKTITKNGGIATVIVYYDLAYPRGSLSEYEDFLGSQLTEETREQLQNELTIYRSLVNQYRNVFKLPFSEQESERKRILTEIQEYDIFIEKEILVDAKVNIPNFDGGLGTGITIYNPENGQIYSPLTVAGGIPDRYMPGIGDLTATYQDFSKLTDEFYIVIRTSKNYRFFKNFESCTKQDSVSELYECDLEQLEQEQDVFVTKVAVNEIEDRTQPN